MTDPKAEKKEPISPDLVPAGWTAEQFKGLSERLADRAARFVRYCADNGLRIRYVSDNPRAHSLVCEVIDENGRRVTFDTEAPPVEKFSVAAQYGLAVSFHKDGERIAFTAVDDAVEASSDEPANEAPRRGRKRGDD